MEVEGLRGAPTHLTKQLQQLAGLPSLSSISLLDDSCPTLFINALATRLTALHLGASYRQIQYGTQAPTPAWQATLQHVARCTALQSLTIPCVTSEDLGVVAPALQRLRRLHLNGPGVAVDGGAMVERLLGLPHLTSLRWEDVSDHAFQRSHASSPCQWRELSFRFIAPHQLACLPLHSLTSPVAWGTVIVYERTSVAEVQAAVDNVTRRCPAGGVWRPQQGKRPTLQFFIPANSDTFTRGAGEGDTPAALLHALRPLLAARGVQQLGVSGLAWDMEAVQALGEVLPRTCAGLCLERGSLLLPACVQLASSQPWLEVVWFCELHVHPHAISMYVSSAVSRADALLPGGRAALREVHVYTPAGREGVGEEAHRRDWEQVRNAVVGLGVGVEVWLSI